MHGTIITNPYDKNAVQGQKVSRMREEFAKLGVEVDVIPNNNFIAYLKDGVPTTTLQTDFVLYFDKDKYTCELLEKCGIRVFNNSKALSVCDDKMQTHIALSGVVDMPTTLAGTLCYTPNTPLDREYLQKAVDILRLPMVVKQCYGSFGEQVYLANTFDDLCNIVQKIQHKAYLLQQYIPQSHGKDVRVIVIGGKVVCAMLRSNTNDFRSNISLGGSGEPFVVTKEMESICKKVAQTLHLDYCGIDILLGEKPLVCEVNSNAMFQGMERVANINVAQKYAEHIVNTTKEAKH